MTKVTFEKWQHEYEPELQTLSRLCSELECDKRHVTFLHCAVCKKYERSHESPNNFSKVWITGSANQKVSIVLIHATSDVHKVAMARLQANSVRTRGGSAVLAGFGDRP